MFIKTCLNYKTKRSLFELTKYINILNMKLVKITPIPLFLVALMLNHIIPSKFPVLEQRLAPFFAPPKEKKKLLYIYLFHKYWNIKFKLLIIKLL